MSETQRAFVVGTSQPAQAVPQWRSKGSSQWWDGYPDNEDGGGPYETHTLYAHGIKQPGSEA